MKQFLRWFRKASDAFDQKFGWFFMNGNKNNELWNKEHNKL